MEPDCIKDIKEHIREHEEALITLHECLTKILETVTSYLNDRTMSGMEHI